MTTLENSYCVPNNSQWVELTGYVPNRDTAIYAVYDAEMGILDACDGEVNYLTEIPVQHFIDLVEDRITPWRLEEVSFRSTNPNDSASNVFFKRMSYMASVHVSYMDGKLHDISIEPYGSEEVASIDELNISTFTELLNLIKFLTPPTK